MELTSCINQQSIVIRMKVFVCMVICVMSLTSGCANTQTQVSATEPVSQTAEENKSLAPPSDKVVRFVPMVQEWEQLPGTNCKITVRGMYNKGTNPIPFSELRHARAKHSTGIKLLVVETAASGQRICTWPIFPPKAGLEALSEALDGMQYDMKEAMLNALGILPRK